MRKNELTKHQDRLATESSPQGEVRCGSLVAKVWIDVNTPIGSKTVVKIGQIKQFRDGTGYSDSIDLSELPSLRGLADEIERCCRKRSVTTHSI